MTAGRLFNAVAFAGAGFLFLHINKSGYEAEAKRHNKALEQLAKEKQRWYEPEIAKEDKPTRMYQELSDASADINDTNHPLDLLRKVRQEEQRRFQYTGENGRNYSGEPQLSSFYTPSPEMRRY